MSRVLAVVHGYPPEHLAGAEMMMHSMLRALAGAGMDVSVVVTGVEGSANVPPTTPVPEKAHVLDGIRVLPVTTASDVAERVKRADVLVTHLGNSWFMQSLASAFGTRFVSVVHNTFDRYQYAPVGADLIVYNSKWMHSDYAAWWRRVWGSTAVAMPASLVVRPPVLFNDYETVPGDRVTLVNLASEKGGELFYTLASRMPWTQFLGVQGSYGWQQIHPMPNVEVMGKSTRMRDEVYARSKVVLMPSVYESWGRVGVEAMCSGIPVIAHPTPGLKEALGGAGIFCDRDDPDAWVGELNRLLYDEDEYAQASARARKRARFLEKQRVQDTIVWVDAIGSLAEGGRRALAS